jgi:hypothetical protein
MEPPGKDFQIVISKQDQFESFLWSLVRVQPDLDGSDPYEVPKAQGKFQLVESGNSLTTELLVQRILSRRMEFEQRNIQKEKKELAAIDALAKLQQQPNLAN